MATGQQEKHKMEIDENGDMEPIHVEGNRELNFGLRWDFVGNEPIDLDASCVSFDKQGTPGEVVFYNNLVTKGKWMIHTGDNTTGEGDDDDEAIQVILERVPNSVEHLVFTVTCHNKGTYLSNVKSIDCIVTDTVQEEEVCKVPITLSKVHTAIILCALSRADGDGSEPDAPSPTAVRTPRTSNWKLKALNVPAVGHSVGETRLLMKIQSQLELATTSEAPVLGIDYTLSKGDVAQITGDLKHLMMGLGWSKEDCDLDASAIFLDENGRYLDYVTAKKKHSAFNHACTHSGDNAFEGQGDRETIHVKLDEVAANVQYIYFSVTCNGKDVWATHKLGGTTGGYCRLVHIAKKAQNTRAKTHNLEDRKELCRINVAKLARDVCALLFAVVYRDVSKAGGWAIKMLGDKLLHENVLIPGEFLPLARCATYFIDAFNRVQDKVGMMTLDWEKMREISHKKIHLRVSILQARDLKPQDVVFRCHCIVWLKDRSSYRCQRQQTSHCTDRDNISWNEGISLGANFTDTVRIMVLDAVMVGVVDIPLFLPDDSQLTLWEQLNNGDVLDSWYPVCGSGVMGELHLKLEKSSQPLVDHNDSWCCIT